MIEFATIIHCVAEQVEEKNGSDLRDDADDAAGEDLRDGGRGRQGRVVRGYQRSARGSRPSWALVRRREQAVLNHTTAQHRLFQAGAGLDRINRIHKIIIA